MASAISNPKKNRRPARLAGQQRPQMRPIPVEIESVTEDGNDVTIVFNQSVSLTGIPQFLKNGTIAPISASMSAPNTLVLSYPGAGPVATDLSIPGDDPAIRSASG